MQKVIEGNLVHYEIVGDGKKNLLVLPGWLSSLKEWLPVADALKEKYRVILLDFPGFGESSKPKEDWGVYEYADFVKKFLRELGVEKTIIIGHSFGGRIAILLGENSELVEKLILVDSAGMELKSIKTQMVSLLKPLSTLFPKNIKDKLGSEDYKTSGQMKNIFKKVVNQPLGKELPKIKTPTFVVWGEKDKVLSLVEAKMIKKGISGSVLRIVWGGSHWPHLDKKDDFLEILKEENVL